MRVFVRIIKSTECDRCATYIPRLQKQGYEFELYDGDDPKNEKELDEWDVDQFPVIQIVSEDNGYISVEYQYAPGTTLAAKFIDIKKHEIENKLRRRA